MSIASLRSWTAKWRWGIIVPVTCIVIGGGLVVYDWRKTHNDLIDANAQIVAISTERDTLLLKVTADEAARKERGDLLIAMAASQSVQLDAVAEAVEAAGPTAEQELPQGLKDALRRR